MAPWWCSPRKSSAPPDPQSHPQPSAATVTSPSACTVQASLMQKGKQHKRRNDRQGYAYKLLGEKTCLAACGARLTDV
eukprot:26390-Eustigmatos_ZCMA.PRE.1